VGARNGMNGHLATARIATRSEPVIVAVTSVPLLNESMAAALDGIAVLSRFPSEVSDLAGLVRHIAPNALVGDSSDNIAELASIGEALSIPVVHVSLETQELRVLHDRNWTAFPAVGMSPLTIRNVLMGAIYGASVRKRENHQEGLRID
jgi:hypothetical protein